MIIKNLIRIKMKNTIQLESYIRLVLSGNEYSMTHIDESVGSVARGLGLAGAMALGLGNTSTVSAKPMDNTTQGNISNSHSQEARREVSNLPGVKVISDGIFNINGNTFNANNFDFHKISRGRLKVMKKLYGEIIIQIIRILKSSQSTSGSSYSNAQSSSGAHIPKEEIINRILIYYTEDNDAAREEAYNRMLPKIQSLAAVSKKLDVVSKGSPHICFTGISGKKVYLGPIQLENPKMGWSHIMKTLTGRN
jgi:hypothetical protein